MSTALRTYYRGHNLVTLRDKVAATSRAHHFDHQGTTQCLTDSSGAVTDRFAADAWGGQVKRNGASENPHWYAGLWGLYRQSSGVRLYYQRQRYYRFASADWLTLDHSPNPR